MPCNVSWAKECDGARQFTARRPTLSAIQRLTETTELSFATHRLPFLPDFIWQKRWTEHRGVTMRWETQVWRWSWRWHCLVRTSEVTGWEKKNHNQTNEWSCEGSKSAYVCFIFHASQRACWDAALWLWLSGQVGRCEPTRGRRETPAAKCVLVCVCELICGSAASQAETDESLQSKQGLFSFPLHRLTDDRQSAHLTEYF